MNNLALFAWIVSVPAASYVVVTQVQEKETIIELPPEEYKESAPAFQNFEGIQTGLDGSDELPPGMSRIGSEQ